MMLNDILNFYAVSPSLATAGLPEPSQFTEIRDAGYETVISLLPGTTLNDGTDEQTLVGGLGMNFIQIPVIWTNPTTENLEVFFQALQANQGRKVFVHCAMNFRASAFTFLYRVLVEKIPVETAKPAMDEIWEPYEVWPEFIDQQLQRYAD